MPTYSPYSQVEVDFVSAEDEAREDEFGASFGDPRRCPRHPMVHTSSDDGMFDAPCYMCEGEGEEAALLWNYDPENAFRTHCALEIPVPLPHYPATCQDAAKADDADDEIPF